MKIFYIDKNGEEIIKIFKYRRAVYRLQHGESVDLRDISSVVEGDEASRHSLVLAKSMPEKKQKI